jgi:SmpA / OmlA family
MNPPSKSTIAMAVLLLVGCAPSVQPGASMGDVESRMGKPVDVVKAPDGDTVWQYPKGPYGQFTYMARFGADQRVKSFTQALTLDNFYKIQNGMTKDEIRLMFGRPGEVYTYRNLNQEAWFYRFQAPVAQARIYGVYFDATTSRVQSISDQKDELFDPTNYGTGGGTGR